MSIMMKEVQVEMLSRWTCSDSNPLQKCLDSNPLGGGRIEWIYSFIAFFFRKESSSTKSWLSFKSFPPSIHLYHHCAPLATLAAAMLDVFGSVFGRSKKESKTVQQQNEGQQQPSPSSRRNGGGSSGSEGEAEGFTVLNPNQPPSVMYPMILTDEVSHDGGGLVDSFSDTPAQMLRSPPSSTSNATTTNTSSAMNDPSSQRSSSLSTPMDSVPFTPNAFYSSSGSGIRSTDNLGKCISTIDRVGHFIATADYNFSLERGVLRE